MFVASHVQMFVSGCSRACVRVCVRVHAYGCVDVNVRVVLCCFVLCCALVRASVQMSHEDRLELCGKLKEINFWSCLSHTSIESAYRCPAIPDRFVTIALMSENRHLMQLHDELADEVCVCL